MQISPSITLAQITTALGLPSAATPELRLSGVNSLAQASPSELSFMASDNYLKAFEATRAVAVVVHRRANLPDMPTRIILRVDNVDAAMAKVLALFAPPASRPAPGIDPSAHVHPSATIASDASIAPLCVIGANTRLGARCILHPGVVIGDNVIIGDDCELHSNVVIRERITLGHRVVIHAGSVLGTDGFGYTWDGKQHLKIPQIGTVVIEDDVELGSCVCIDRAKFGATVVGRGSKIDNLVQIAHNVKTGAHCIMAGQVGIAGSATLGTGVIIGGASSIRDHITIGDGAIIAARSAVHEDVPAKAIVSGMPALPHRQSLREQGALRRLPEMMTEIRKMQEQVQKYLESLQSDADPLGQ